MCQSNSHVGTAEVDLINLPFIQTPNYTQSQPSQHNQTLTEGEKETLRGGKSGRISLQHTQRDKKVEDILGKKAEHGKQSRREEGKKKDPSLLQSLQQAVYLGLS